MTSPRRTAAAIGVLYIIGTVAGVTGLLVMPSFDPGTDVLGQVANHRMATVIGGLLVLTMGFALSALSAVFYPIGRRFSETLATGYVVFRGALEGMTYVISALLWFTLVALASKPSGMAAIATALQTAQGLIWEPLVALPFSVGALMFYWLLFKTRLVPRWITVWGFVSLALSLAAHLAYALGYPLDVLQMSLLLQEMVLAVWLIAKGFDAKALASVGLGADAADAETPATTRARGPKRGGGAATPGRPRTA
jgi:hypothetical protein